MNIATKYNGTLSQNENSVAKVYFWHVPGGYDVANATVYSAYFSRIEDATEFAERFSAPPEMAVINSEFVVKN